MIAVFGFIKCASPHELDQVIDACRRRRMSIAIEESPPSGSCSVPGLFRIMAERGITAVSLEAALGFRRFTGRISHWKNGSASPPVKLLMRIAAYFNVTIDELIKP